MTNLETEKGRVKALSKIENDFMAKLKDFMIMPQCIVMYAEKKVNTQKKQNADTKIRFRN